MTSPCVPGFQTPVVMSAPLTSYRAGAEVTALLKDEYVATSICTLLQVNSADSIGQTVLVLKLLCVVPAFCTCPVMNWRPTSTAAACKVACANKKSVVSMMTNSIARNAGAISANSTIV